MRTGVWAVIGSAAAWQGGCTYHVAIGGQGKLLGDDKIGAEEAPRGAPSLLVGAGPCLRWPRVRASLTFDAALRGISIVPLAATEVMWIFLEGHAQSSEGRTRTSLGLKGRLAGGWNGITNRRIAEAGLGIAIVLDSDRMRGLNFANRYARTGDFHAVSLDVIATYAPDRRGEDEVWLGAQLAFHLNGWSSPPPPIGGSRVANNEKYNKPEPGQSTDCNGGHLP
jgi:hypothetical protein